MTRVQLTLRAGLVIIASYGGAMIAYAADSQTSPQPTTEQHLQPEVNAPPDKLTAGQQDALEKKGDACPGCHRVRGRVVQNDKDTLVVKDNKKNEVKMKFDQNLRKGQYLGQTDPKNSTFVEGDRIEAMVTADGRIWSVTQLKQLSNQPGVDAEGD